MATRYLYPLISVLLLSGCSLLDGEATRGLLYTNIIRPYSIDFSSSPVGTKSCLLDEHQLREPVSGYGVSVEWTSDMIKKAAKQAGISRISYIELQTTSYITGIYRRQRLIIHGE